MVGPTCLGKVLDLVKLGVRIEERHTIGYPLSRGSKPIFKDYLLHLLRCIIIPISMVFYKTNPRLIETLSEDKP